MPARAFPATFTDWCEMPEPKMERAFLIPGTLNTIRVTCELDANNRDTSSVSVTDCRTEKALTTARLIVTDDARFFVLARAACVVGSPVSERCAVLTLLGYVEAWYGEFVGQMLLRMLKAFADSPPNPDADPSGDSGG